jgi:MFS family permease
VLGIVSLLTDMSSEFIHALLPVFLFGTLGASALAIGLIEGAAEGLALATKVFSGYLSDVFGRRKPLIVLGYGLAALTKPLFPLAASVHWVLGARLLDRVGKGIRGAPRDALVADVTPKEIRGAAFGMRQALDTVGGFAGPLLAIGAMLYFVGDIRAALWIAVVPGVVAVALLLFAVREPERTKRVAAKLPLSREGLRRLGGTYWKLVAIGSLLTFARSTEAFLVLRGSNLGLSNTLVPLVLVVMSLVYTLAAYPAGKWSDQGGRRPLLVAGMLVLAVADVVLALAGGLVGLFAGIALWGLHMGLTQGLFAAYIADLAPGELRGTAFGVFNLATGFVLLLASALSGFVWDAFSPAATFWMGGALALVGAAALFALPRRAA